MNATSNAATVTSTESKPYDTDARTARNRNLEIRDSQKLPPVAVQGNTFPLRGVLWALGGVWNKEQRCYLMPAHTAQEAQGIINDYAAAHVKQPKAPKADKPVVKITPAQVIAAAEPVTPATGIPIATFAKRIHNLGMITDQVVTDLLANHHVEAAAEVVKAMAGFNNAHKALGV
jgi:hypothetical protein